MKWSAAERSRPTPLDGLVALLVLLAAAALIFAFRPAGGNFLTATVVLDGETVDTFPLTGAQARTYDVPGAPYPITLEIEDGRVRVLHSDCPSQDCVRTGWVARSGGQIVCLPNRLVLSIAGTQAPDVDFVVG